MTDPWHRRSVIAINRRLRESLGQGRGQLVCAMRYALFSGGKRLRPLLCLAAADTCAIAPAARDALLSQACALELVHTYSLIHDDLPCMDDDAQRRGKPTCHIKYGEALALLAGDALLTLAFELLAASGDARAAKVLARACGAAGMIDGQVRDIATRASSLAALKAMHRQKTGQLFAAALVLGAQATNAGKRKLAKLSQLGLELGLLYQINDDIADAAEAGASGRQHTCMSVLGARKTRSLQQRQARHVAQLVAAVARPASPLALMCAQISASAA